LEVSPKPFAMIALRAGSAGLVELVDLFLREPALGWICESAMTMPCRPGVPLPDAAAAFAAACSTLGTSLTPLLPSRAAASARSPKLNAAVEVDVLDGRVSPSTSSVNSLKRSRALSTWALKVRPIFTPATPSAPTPMAP
jgi:hypothetical protein